ncbi:MAG: hypothetical protein HOJ18_15215 [Rhodospirillaceae bacterium]|nr:hypothetical protein [Rhodospirillaceae bacterium]
MTVTLHFYRTSKLKIYDNGLKEMAVRQLIRDAFQCDELVHQFKILDVEDGLLTTGSEKEVSQNKLYTDMYITDEAKNRLDLTNKKIDRLGEDTDNDATYKIELEFLEKEKNQLLEFLTKWGPKDAF